MLIYSSFFVPYKYFYRGIARVSLRVYREGANVLGDLGVAPPPLHSSPYDTRQRQVVRQPWLVRHRVRQNYFVPYCTQHNLKPRYTLDTRFIFHSILFFITFSLSDFKCMCVWRMCVYVSHAPVLFISLVESQ